MGNKFPFWSTCLMVMMSGSRFIHANPPSDIIPSPDTVMQGDAPLLPVPEPLTGKWQGNVFVGKVENPVPMSSMAHPSRAKVEPRRLVEPKIDSFTFNASLLQSLGRKVYDGIFGQSIRLATMATMGSTEVKQVVTPKSPGSNTNAEPLKGGPFLMPSIMSLSPVFTHESKKKEVIRSPALTLTAEESRTGGRDDEDDHDTTIRHHKPIEEVTEDNRGNQAINPMDDLDPLPVEDEVLSHGVKSPPCGQQGRFYCSFKEDYPTKVVTEVTRYYKWPLEKLFRDLRQQVMPKLANDNFGGLVCDSITRVVRPGWARNTNNKWLVVINTDNYQQFVTEVVCRNGANAPCNFIPPCYSATCAQRYNTQKLLVIDPWNPYKGPFVSEFLFPSCCICYVPTYTGHTNTQSEASARGGHKTPYADRSKAEL